MAIDIMAAFSQEPAPLDFVLPGLLRGTVGAIVSPGGAGKSMLAMELSILVAAGIDLSGLLKGTEYPTGKVVFLAAEDPASAIIQRLHAIGKFLNEDQRQAVAKNLILEPLIGFMPNILNPKWFEAIKRVSDGARLLIIDTLRRFHLSDENDSGEMADVIGHIEAIAAPQDLAAIFAHHTSKTSAMNEQGDMQQASRGSSVLVDNIRWQMYLSNMTAKEAGAMGVDEARRGYFVRTGVSKQNYGAPLPEHWMLRVEGGVLRPGEFSTNSITAKKTDPGDNW